MDETHLSDQTLQLATVWEDFLRLQPRIKALVPEDLAALKGRLSALHPEGGRRRAADYDLFYRIGAALSRREEPMTMSEISEALGVPANAATRTADWLVESGYADRWPDPADRRVVRVALTPAGRELYEAIDRFIRQRVGQILQHFSPEEREELIRLLRKLVGALGEELAR